MCNYIILFEIGEQINGEMVKECFHYDEVNVVQADLIKFIDQIGAIDDTNENGNESNPVIVAGQVNEA